MANANLFQQYLQPPKSVLDYSNEMDRADALRSNNAIQALTLQQQQQQMRESAEDRNALQRVASTARTTDDLIAGLQGSGRPALMQRAEAMAKQRLEQKNIESQIGERGAKTDADKFKLEQDRQKVAIQRMAALGNAQDAVTELQGSVQRGEVPPHVAETLAKTIPQDPAEFQRWKLKMIVGLTDPAKMVELLKPHLQTNNTGGSTVTQAFDPLTGQLVNTSSIRNTQSPDNAATVAATIRGQDKTDARAREHNAIMREGQQTQVINDPVRGPMLVNKGTGLVRPGLGLDGKPVPGETVVKRQQASTNALPVIEEAKKLIDESTGSFVGRGVDYAARGVGYSTSGDQANAKLKVLQANLMLAQPRMEGPQSDKDVQLYREAAGQIGDATVPADIKRAALDTIEQMHRKYANPGQPTAPAAPTAASGFKIIGVK